MPKVVSMVVSLTAITTVCGLALGAFNAVTAPVIEEQLLRNKQVPAAAKVLPEARNDLLADRVTLEPGGEADAGRILFPARKAAGQAPYGVAFESTGNGYGGALGVVVGFDLEQGALAGVAVSSHSETPGVGDRTVTQPAFAKQFAGMPFGASFRVRQDGGEIDALSGATVTSRAVCEAVAAAVAYYQEHEAEIRRLVGSSEQGGGR